MKNEFLLNAMADIDETYIQEAQKAPTAGKRKLPWKALLAAALIPLLTVTAFAAFTTLLTSHSIYLAYSE